jgi:glycerol-3-phosphate dehydrogenase
VKPAATLDQLAAGPPLDVAIIGGGINGCAVFREAVGRGLRAALFEQDDFGFGTTWRSTKLIHGGLRYLEHGDVRLVFESLRERAWLLRVRPHLVQPQRFLLPMLPWSRRPAWQFGAGLAMYDFLALYRGVPHHRRLSDAALHRAMPALVAATRGGFSFYDARVVAPERLALELAMEGRRMGGHLFNHARVAGIRVSGGGVSGIEVESGGRRFGIPARAVVNAAGPWVDAVNALTGVAPRLLGVTRGSHVVFEPPVPPLPDAVFSTAREDGRVFFAVPQGRLLLVGTTDDRYEADPGAARPTAADADYLLSEAQALLPGYGLSREAVRYAFAGLRPLQQVAGGPESAITRRHVVTVHARRGGLTGLVSVTGGKLSTFRPLAREALDALGLGTGRRSPALAAPTLGWDDMPASDLTAESRQHLRMYGAAIPAILAGGRDVLCPHSGAVHGELRQAVGELANTLSDVLMRRTGIAWSACRGLCCHVQAASLLAPMLGWDAAECARQVAAFEADAARHLPTLGQLGTSDSAV